MSWKDPYEILGVNKDTSNEEIKKAYRRLSLQHHPDKWWKRSIKLKFQEITGAYEKINENKSKPDKIPGFMGNNALIFSTR